MPKVTTSACCKDEEEEGTIDVLCYFILGPLLRIDLLAVPPQPYNVNGWVMTKGNIFNLETTYSFRQKSIPFSDCEVQA